MNSNQERSPLCRRFIVCEDGTEYIERFLRFLGDEFEFIAAADYPALLELLELGEAYSGILLDLDFRRTESARLVNEHGQSPGRISREALTQYVTNQGLFILASLRERGATQSVLLFADIDDAQRHYVERTFGPVEVVPSHVGLRELKTLLASCAPRLSLSKAKDPP